MNIEDKGRRRSGDKVEVGLRRKEGRWTKRFSRSVVDLYIGLKWQNQKHMLFSLAHCMMLFVDV